MDYTAVFVPITSFIVIAYIIKIVSDNRIRHRLIEKGIPEENAKMLFGGKIESRSMSSLKWGLVLTGIGLALFIGQLFPRSISEEMTVGGMFIFAGLGFLIFYFITQRMDKAAIANKSSGN